MNVVPSHPGELPENPLPETVVPEEEEFLSEEVLLPLEALLLEELLLEETIPANVLAGGVWEETFVSVFPEAWFVEVPSPGVTEALVEETLVEELLLEETTGAKEVLPTETEEVFAGEAALEA